MHTIKFNDVVLDSPSHWNDLTKKQLLNVCSITAKKNNLDRLLLFLFTAVNGLTVEKKKSLTIEGVEHFPVKYNGKVYLISCLDLHVLSKTMLFLFKEVTLKDESTAFILYSRLNKNIIPVLPNGWNGPADSLSNLVYDEYIHAETNYYRYLKYKDEIFLNRLIATLYRPVNPSKKVTDLTYNGDLREDFNDFLIDGRATLIAKLNPVYKKAILLFYEGCKAFIKHTFPVMHEGSSESNEDIFMTQIKIVDALSKSDVTKKDQVRKTLLWDVLPAMEEILKLRKKEEEELEKLKSKR